MKNIGKKLAILALTTLPMAVNAQVGTMNIDSYELSIGEVKNIPVMVSDGIASADGDIIVNDNTCLEIVEVNSSFGSGNYFADIDLEGKELGTVASIKVKALKECKTNITIKNASLGTFAANDEESGLTFISGDITVKANETKVENTNIKNEEVKTTSVVKNNNVTKNTIKLEETTNTEELVETVNEVVEENENIEVTETKSEETVSIAKKIINLLKELIKLLER